MKRKDHKYPSDSQTVKTEVVCPDDTNPMGILKGGRLVEWMDIAAAVCAQTHAGTTCVTASINQVDFRQSAGVGDIIIIRAGITRSFHSSMEIFVEAFARRIGEANEYPVSEAFFNFVALDAQGRPVGVAMVKPVTLPERQRFRAALSRKKKRALQKSAR